jgi:hypothetical protein
MNFRQRLSRSIQYLYFLRFSIFFWLLIPILAWKDNPSGISAISRGIFTPALFGQFVGAAFFIVCIGMVVLVTARLVCLNGEDRFLTEPPHWLEKTLGTESEDWAGRVLLYFQLPGACVIYYLHYNAWREHAVAHTWFDTLYAICGSLLGIALAFLFWWIVDAIYYWTYCYSERGTAARTLLFPRSFLGLKPIGEAGQHGMTLETDSFQSPRIFSPLTWLEKQIARLGPGYAPQGGTLWEGHRFAAIAWFCYLAVYIFLFPLTSPTPQHYGYRLDLAGFALVLALLALGVFKTTPQGTAVMKGVLVGILAVACVIAIVFLFITPSSIEGFPVLGSMLVLITFLALIFSAIAFWADRYRLPVFTTFIVVLFLFHLVPLGGDHYFRAKELKTASSPFHPAQIFERRNCTDKAASGSCPIIIVTATGGGIHAASWTATVLTELEIKMQQDPSLNREKFTFHNHLLYVSAVSGGSVGLVPFLREYYADKPFTPVPIGTDVLPNWAGRIRRAANCSSLEAVGWGLEYSDFLHMVFPVLTASPTRDRSAALDSAFARNITRPECDWRYGDEYSSKNGKSDRGLPPVDALTLAGMAEDLKRTPGLKRPADLPAFALNTTAAETGGRFLLANYVNGSGSASDYGVPPAESFLAAYGRGETGNQNADIELVTAARLSASFPYVSSAARIGDPFKYGADHFVDGGYFDNDGTSSAIEFLEEAFSEDKANVKVPVLFIEIRDGSDLSNTSDESYANQNQAHLSKSRPQKVIKWKMFNQITAPLGAFWQSGHVSVTRRNRRELELLMEHLKDKADFTHIVFDYQEPSPSEANEQASQPLSWHLTPNQKNNINASMKKLDTCVQRTIGWARNDPQDYTGPDVVCNHNGIISPRR